MKNKCDCYETVERLCYTPSYTQSYYKTVGICNGTKEREECSCGGNKTKCDFYPEVRDKVNKEIMLCKGCIICGEPVELTPNEELSLRHGFHIDSKVCDKCREAILHTRKQIESVNVDKFREKVCHLHC